jgi:carbon storage regulator
MLVLSRKVGEAIHIGDQITVIVSRIDGNRVRLALNAPRDVHIVRSELEPLSARTRSADRIAKEEPAAYGGPQSPR